MNLHPGVKLGKAPPRHSYKTAHFANFLVTTTLPAAPPARDFTDKAPADLGVMKNDTWGNCAFAAQGHATQIWTSQTGAMFTPTDDQVLAAYSGCTGFDPSKPETDQGTVMLDALNYWRTIGIAGHKIGAFVKVDHHNLDHVKCAINMFGGLYTGVDLPLSAQHQQIWTGAQPGALIGNDAPGSWGGHATWTPKYDRDFFGTITWGSCKMGDWQWWLDNTDEAYAIISLDWVTGSRPAPSGFDMPKLQAYIAAL